MAVTAKAFRSLGEAAAEAERLGIADAEAKLRIFCRVFEKSPGSIPGIWLQVFSSKVGYTPNERPSGWVGLLRQPLAEIVGIRDAVLGLAEHGMSRKDCLRVCRNVFRFNSGVLSPFKRPGGPAPPMATAERVRENLAKNFEIAEKEFGLTRKFAVKLSGTPLMTRVIVHFRADRNRGRYRQAKEAWLNSFVARSRLVPREGPHGEIASWIMRPETLRIPIKNPGALKASFTAHLGRQRKARRAEKGTQGRESRCGAKGSGCRPDQKAPKVAQPKLFKSFQKSILY